MSSRFAFTAHSIVARARVVPAHDLPLWQRITLASHTVTAHDLQIQSCSRAPSPLRPLTGWALDDDTLAQMAARGPWAAKRKRGGRTPSQMALGRARRTRGDGCGSRRDARHRPCCRTRPRVRQLAGSKLREARNWATPTPKGSQCMHACTHACTHSTGQYSTLQYSTVRPCL